MKTVACPRFVNFNSKLLKILALRLSCIIIGSVACCNLRRIAMEGFLFGLIVGLIVGLLFGYGVRELISRRRRRLARQRQGF
jgi:membrane associated rhomboid family serine protease